MRQISVSDLQLETLLPFNIRRLDDAVLISNDLGTWHILSSEDFASFVTGGVALGTSLRESLEREVSALRRQSSAASGDGQALQRAIEEGRRAQGELATAQSERAAAQQQLSRTTSERDAEKR